MGQADMANLYKRLQSTEVRISVKPIPLIDCTKQITTNIINEIMLYKNTGRREWTSLSIAPKSAIRGGFSFIPCTFIILIFIY